MNDGFDDRFQACGWPVDPPGGDVDILSSTPVGAEAPSANERLVFVSIANGQRRPPKSPPPLIVA